jgi:hypothetical protein
MVVSMTKDEALKLALEALELHGKQYPHMVKGYCLDAITTIKEALAQPEQKSVAMADYMALTEKYVALKATQRTWVGLTKDEVEILAYKAEGNTWKAVELAEAKLREKNT